MTTEFATGLGLLIAFLAVVVMIIRGQSPIIMLLILAVLWAAIAGIGVDEIQKKIIQGGGVQYASAVIIIVFGAWFAQVLIQTGIAESVIRSAVELAGDRRHRAADHDEPGHSTLCRRAGVHDGHRRRNIHQPRSIRNVSETVSRHQV